MADPSNPFAGFFSGLRSGLEAGESAERRGDSFFKTMVRAVAGSDLTPQDRRMQQELEFRMADQALRTNIAAQRQELSRQQHLQEVAEENARLEDEIKDAPVLNELTSRMANVSTLEEWEAFPQNSADLINALSPSGAEAWRKAFTDAGKGARMERLLEMQDMRQELVGLGFSEGDIPKNYGELKRFRDTILADRISKEPLPPGVSSITRQLPGGGQVTVRADEAPGTSTSGRDRAIAKAHDALLDAVRDYDAEAEGDQENLSGREDVIRSRFRAFIAAGGDPKTLSKNLQERYKSIIDEFSGGRERTTTDDPIPEGIINKDNAPSIINILSGTYR